MTFNTNNPTNTAERNLNILIARAQKNGRTERAIKFTKANWAELGEDFRKACYWVFGRETFVVASRFKASDELINTESKILASYEDDGLFDV